MSLSTADVGAVSPTAASSLGLQDFVRVLTTQLTYQDPLKPMDNQEFMAQVAQFTALEQSQQMNERLQQLIGNQAALQSVGLIGRNIEFTTSTGRSSGIVSALSLQGDAPLLTVSLAGGTVVNDVTLGQLLSVR
ncbi:flagellar hook capping protein [Ramlibacter sp. USB13]|uniref:Basal-body rod modification protein FlgD n=1 Tax=Ramlibacter cellulosilyticus TaxID=2764187 RepID=A0A923MVU8_9BURK|nr:flagellar hook capping FlgD N-terminal domain-containing protein [Ramlibacter cellulosilyticus]MBC5785104.1 flagellar hook capping protein [Ramlibacter cellulosilyticus]